jgi:hypothetical protein
VAGLIIWGISAIRARRRPDSAGGPQAGP